MSAADSPRPLEKAAAAYFLTRDEESLNHVVEAASDLIRYFVRLYGKGCDQDDLFQTGMLGLLKALQNYDPEKGAGFSTYASHLIMGEIRHLVRKNASYYRPGCIVELQFKVDKVVAEHIKLQGGVPSVETIARELNVKPESVSEVMRAGLVPFDDVDTAVIRNSAYETFRLPIEDKITLYNAIRKLSDIQQKVIAMLFFQDKSQQQVADELGLTQRQVSRIKHKSLEQMQGDIVEAPEPAHSHHN
jgi:RNA polymerase sigma-B factor